MLININDLITLDDNNEYVVVSKCEFENKVYFYIVDINDNSNLKFCYLNNDEFIELSDGELVKKLLPLFKLRF